MHDISGLGQSWSAAARTAQRHFGSGPALWSSWTSCYAKCRKCRTRRKMTSSFRSLARWARTGLELVNSISISGPGQDTQGRRQFSLFGHALCRDGFCNLLGINHKRVPWLQLISSRTHLLRKLLVRACIRWIVSKRMRVEVLQWICVVSMAFTTERHAT